MLREDGTLIATTKYDAFKPASEDAAERSRDYVRRHWKHVESISLSAGSCFDSSSSCQPDPSKSLLNQIQRHSLCISGMAFQDAWNIDLDRLKRCCVHVATLQKRLVPFCSYYMTDSNGRRLVYLDSQDLLK